MADLLPEAAIVEALLWRAEQVAAGLKLPIAYPDVPFTKPTEGVRLYLDRQPVELTKGKPWLAATVLPSTADLIGIAFDSDAEHQGLLQVSVFWPAGQGLVKASQAAGGVVAGFAPGLAIARNGVEVRVYEMPGARPALQESDWNQIPVIVRWRACALGHAAA